jgi:hypothetical protein
MKAKYCVVIQGRHGHAATDDQATPKRNVTAASRNLINSLRHSKQSLILAALRLGASSLEHRFMSEITGHLRRQFQLQAT